MGLSKCRCSLLYGYTHSHSVFEPVVIVHGLSLSHCQANSVSVFFALPLFIFFNGSTPLPRLSVQRQDSTHVCVCVLLRVDQLCMINQFLNEH